MTTKKSTNNALDIIKVRYYQSDERRLRLEEARVHAEAARLIYAIRTEAKLSQKDLAQLIGTTQSVISRLEDGDYDGHSLSMLSKITAALNKRLVLSVEASQ
jgi:ribosome-binding protein aMBF1 (putative translation factor)